MIIWDYMGLYGTTSGFIFLIWDCPHIWDYMGVSINGGTPIAANSWMVFDRENPICL